MIYTGIGSRETTPEVISVMEDAAFRLARMKFTLRSGKAGGADAAFQRGVQNYFYSLDKEVREEDTIGRAEIYIPWNGFKSEGGLENWWDISLDYIDRIFPSQIGKRNEILAEMHPNYDALLKKPGAFALHSRNIHQILGPNLVDAKPSRFCLYYALEDRNGKPRGGTATAVKLAIEHGVRTLNLLHEENREILESFISVLEEQRGIKN